MRRVHLSAGALCTFQQGPHRVQFFFSHQSWPTSNSHHINETRGTDNITQSFPFDLAKHVSWKHRVFDTFLPIRPLGHSLDEGKIGLEACGFEKLVDTFLGARSRAERKPAHLDVCRHEGHLVMLYHPITQ